MYFTLYLQDTSKQLAQRQKIIRQAKGKQAEGKQAEGKQAKGKQAKGKQIPAVKEAANTTRTYSPPYTQDPKHSGSLTLMPGPSFYNSPPLSHYTLARAPYSTPCCTFSPHSTAIVYPTPSDHPTALPHPIPQPSPHNASLPSLTLPTYPLSSYPTPSPHPMPYHTPSPYMTPHPPCACHSHSTHHHLPPRTYNQGGRKRFHRRYNPYY